VSAVAEAKKQPEIKTLARVSFGPLKNGGLLSIIEVNGQRLIVVQERLTWE